MISNLFMKLTIYSKKFIFSNIQDACRLFHFLSIAYVVYCVHISIRFLGWAQLNLINPTNQFDNSAFVTGYNEKIKGAIKDLS